jgi:nicotinamidase/pyrazinamidase
MRRPSLVLTKADALVLVDVQRDFLPGGALAVPAGDAVVPVLNRYIALARERGIPIFATRDWHPANHCSFNAQDGPWPPHCMSDTDGAQFAPGLELPADAHIISKATVPFPDSYSGFGGTTLSADLRERRVKRLLVGGLATDYCVLNTVLDAIREGFEVVLLTDAIRAVNVQAEDGERAESRMRSAGARPARFADFAS